MKKIAILIIGVLYASGLAAQSHSFRDTSYVRYEQFDYDSWVSEDVLHHGKMPFRPMRPITPTQQYDALINEDIVQYNYTDNPTGMEVVGLSAAVYYIPGSSQNPNAKQHALLLYEATPDTFILKGQLTWNEIDTAGRPNGRWLVNNTNCQFSSPLFTGIAEYSDRKVFDLYFDSSIVVYDSFYVGGTSRFGAGNCCYVTFQPPYDTVCHISTMWKIISYNSWIPSGWHWAPTNQFLMVLPIIKVVDTSFANAPECPRVAGLFARGNYTDTVTVQWNLDTLHREFEVSYGREGTRPDDGTIVTVSNSNRWQFMDTAYRDMPMITYVRTVCREYDTLRWGEWGSPVYWRLHHEVSDTTQHDTTQHEGIAVAEESDLSRYVQLMPNPASGSVIVMSSYGIDGVEVYDVRGELVLELSGIGRGTSTGFDVSKWASGTYVVLVRTPAGMDSKRLVVKGN